MKHSGTKELETKRLILRRFTIDDAENMFKNWANDDEVTKYLVWPSHSDINVSIDVLKQWIQNYSNDDFYQWAIVLKETKEPIGSISSVKQSDDLNMVHIGYCIGKNWWNEGIVSEALNELIKYFFEEVGVNRIESRHDPNNPNSGKVMTKCGMKYEGHMRQADKNNQGIVDTVYYGIIADDYFKK
jgi:ribosomal-protein-alanine N-acetyltransferase